MHKLTTFPNGPRIISKKGKTWKTPPFATATEGQAKKKGFTTRSLLPLEAPAFAEAMAGKQRSQRIELDRIDRIFLNLGWWIA